MLKITMDSQYHRDQFIEDDADYEGMLYELKKLGILDGEEFQINNGGDLLIYFDAYKNANIFLKNLEQRCMT
jgi:hypothetical protein